MTIPQGEIEAAARSISGHDKSNWDELSIGSQRPYLRQAFDALTAASQARSPAAGVMELVQEFLAAYKEWCANPHPTNNVIRLTKSHVDLCAAVAGAAAPPSPPPAATVGEEDTVGNSAGLRGAKAIGDARVASLMNFSRADRHSTTSLPAQSPAATGQYEQLVEALEFYADPDTYVAIAFMGDPPCGEFVDDFGDLSDEWQTSPPYNRPMPGKRARHALESLTALSARPTASIPAQTETQELTRSIQEMAGRVGAEFVPDKEKMTAFDRAQTAEGDLVAKLLDLYERGDKDGAARDDLWDLVSQNIGMILDEAKAAQSLRSAHAEMVKALETPPQLDAEQEKVLMQGFGAILPPTEIYKVGWAAAMGFVKPRW